MTQLGSWKDGRFKKRSTIIPCVYLSRQTLLHSLIHLAFPQFIQIRISFSFLVY
jgi:hypothetical protein